jgi:hypothetical protein
LKPSLIDGRRTAAVPTRAEAGEGDEGADAAFWADDAGPRDGAGS